MPQDTPTTLNIQPGVTVFSVFASLEYKAWHALAEYVDNALQSFLSHKAQGQLADQAAVRVEIETDAKAKRIVITDDAGGIAPEEFDRAFKPAEVPTDRSGLSEFGMGMKTASCWFSPNWSVRTTVAGDPVVRTVRFDIPHIVENRIHNLQVEVSRGATESHQTIVELNECHSPPQGRTVGKIKDHLADIYREFLRSGELELLYNGEKLAFTEEELLDARRYNGNHEPEGDPVLWRREIDFGLGENRRITGYAGILAKGSTSRSGFSLFRRRRVIQGSGDEKYRPAAVFGSTNGYVFQRLTGELHLEGFSVSHTKDGFRWDAMEEEFHGLLKEALDDDNFSLLKQARNYRTGVDIDASAKAAAKAVASTGKAMEAHLPAAVRESGATPPVAPPFTATELPPAADTSLLGHHVTEAEIDGESWQVVLDVVADGSTQFIEIAQGVLDKVEGGHDQRVGVRVCLNHPFMHRLDRIQPQTLEVITRVAAGLALAERLSDLSGSTHMANVRLKLNKLLAGPLAKNE